MSPPKLNREKELEVALTIAVALVAVFLYKEGERLSALKYLLAGALLIGIVGLFFKSLQARIAAAWMWLAEKIGSVMNKIILAVIFFLILTPLALLARAARGRRRPLQINRSPHTYYTPRHHRYTARDLERPW
ncbi:MAG: hypothetical protein NZM35_00020 [Chitinophagales bacterium]|nr:hypothetical protein [Chitinophagales bacterium]MDW8417833.1 hypothetical protein [Chitinophagales bacterium]